MSKIEIGRYSEQLRRMFGMAGQESVAEHLSPEVSPTIQIEGESAEWDFLKGVRGCFGSSSVAGAAGFTSKWRLRNPAASGVIAVVRYMSASPNGTTTFVVARAQPTVDLPVPVITVPPDLRWGGGVLNTSLILSSDNTAVGGPIGDQLAQTRILANGEFIFPLEVPLLPGASFEFGTTTVNITTKAWVHWVERRLPPMENTPG